MIVAGVVIETAPGAAPRVAARLLREHRLCLHGGDGDRRLAAVLTAADGAALEQFAKGLLRDDVEVLGVYPTYVGDDEESDDARASATRALGQPRHGER
jgi:hypothetical protein